MRQAHVVQIRRYLPIVLTTLLLVASCGADDEPAAVPSSTTEVPDETTTSVESTGTDSISEALATAHTSVVARAAVDQITVYAEPSEAAAATIVLPRNDPAYLGEGGESIDQVFLVQQYRDGWIEVLLPVRPNGTTGWIRLGDVSVSKHQYEIVIELAAHRMTTTNAGEVIQEADIAVGHHRHSHPGRHVLPQRPARPPDPDTVYGTYAYALSGYSDTLKRFAGGDGVIGIHGTNDPSVVGSDVSHGCIRMRNQDIEALVDELPLGTPVEIRA